ncbi:hypothetical protein D3C80_1698240 [compost metagenome]
MPEAISAWPITGFRLLKAQSPSSRVPPKVEFNACTSMLSPICEAMPWVSTYDRLEDSTSARASAWLIASFMPWAFGAVSETPLPP